jgi:hypothetical protein
MDKPSFHDEASLIEEAVKLGKKAMESQQIPSFVVRYFPDSSQFFIPNEEKSEPLTPEEAYMRLKKLTQSK